MPIDGIHETRVSLSRGILVVTSLKFLFIGNDRALDFVNTSFRGGDVLSDFAAYVDWLQAASVLTAAEARSAANFAGTAEARSAFRALTELRTAIRRSVEAISTERLPSKSGFVKHPVRGAWFARGAPRRTGE
jgi:hypothetical protein